MPPPTGNGSPASALVLIFSVLHLSETTTSLYFIQFGNLFTVELMITYISFVIMVAEQSLSLQTCFASAHTVPKIIHSLTTAKRGLLRESWHLALGSPSSGILYLTKNDSVLIIGRLIVGIFFHSFVKHFAASMVYFMH